MVALDERRRVARDGHGLDDVGVKRALREELGLARFLRRGLEDINERLADDLALLLRVGDALELREEQLGGVLVLQLHLEVLAEDLLHDLGLAGAQQAVVDEDAGELVADGLVQKRGGHAGIHATAQSKDDALSADLRADVRDGLLQVIAHRPVLAAAADAVDEVAVNLSAARRVDDFGVELKAEDAARAVFDDRVVAVLRGGDDGEILRELGELVAVGVPDLERGREILEERAARVVDGEVALAVFALLAFLDLAAVEVREELHAVADAQDGHAELEDGLVRQRRVLRIHAGGPAGEDEAAGLERGDFRRRGVVAQDGGIHVALADAARDDLRVLGTEVEDDDLLVHEVRSVCLRWESGRVKSSASGK